MKKCILIIVLSFYFIPSQSQGNGCDGSRYIDDVFDEISTTLGVKYGEGVTLFGNQQELYLDIYEPENDNLDQRPVIILAFGGSFIGGTRRDIDFICEAYARKGYVAVSIDYRLYDGPVFPFPTADQMKNVVIKTVSDMKAAIRFMRQDADTDNLYRIDPTNVFVGGVSAGSITAFHTAVIDEDDVFEQDIIDILEENGGFEGNSSDNFEYSSEVQGLINFSGGLNNASWIDENDPPFVSVHDDEDRVVPYGAGFASILFIPIIYMEGSKICHEVADSLGIKNQLKTIENSDGHVSYLANPTTVPETLNYAADFIAGLVCGDGPTATDNLAGGFESIQVYPNPTNGIISISEKSDTELKLDLYNAYGKKLNSFSNPSVIDLSNKANGLYFLQLTDMTSEISKTVKVILEK